MSLDFTLVRVEPVQVYTANITHNLAPIARASGLYMALWQPEGLPNVKVAADLVPILTAGLDRLRASPDYYRPYEPANGWGRYEDFVRFVEQVRAACEEFPDASVEACR